jgi:hypothetical protein
MSLKRLTDGRGCGSPFECAPENPYHLAKCANEGFPL